MGATWCRQRIEQAQNSKSPFDRIITSCSNAINAKTNYSKPGQSKPANDIVFKQIRHPKAAIVPVHRVPGPQGEWTEIPLHVPAEKTPVPPPRRKKKRKVNSLDVLNSQLDQIYESRSEVLSAQKRLFFGDQLPCDDPGSTSSSPERSYPHRRSDDDRKRKTRAKKIMETKTKNRPAKLTLHKEVGPGGEGKENWVPPRMLKNASSVSLPSYHEMQVKVDEEKKKEKERNISLASLPGESVLTAISGITINRLEAYMKRCKSFGSLKPQQLLEKLEEFQNRQDTESSDSWSGLDEWDLGIIEYDQDVSDSPISPKCRLSSRRGRRIVEKPPEKAEEDEPEMPATPTPILRSPFQHSEHISIQFPKSEMSALTSPKLLRELSLSDTNLVKDQLLSCLPPVPAGSPPPKAQRTRKSFDPKCLGLPSDELEHSQSDVTLNKGPRASCDSNSIPDDISTVTRDRVRLISERDGLSVSENEEPNANASVMREPFRDSVSDRSSLGEIFHSDGQDLRKISLSADALEPANVKQTPLWYSVPDVAAPCQARTPPPTPVIIIEENKDPSATSNLFKVMSSYSLASDLGPTPPRRRSRDDLRRQSYHGVLKPKLQNLPRSMSLDPTNEDLQPHTGGPWRDVSTASSQHSLSQALNSFLGFSSPGEGETTPPTPPPLPSSPPPMLSVTSLTFNSI